MRSDAVAGGAVLAIAISLAALSLRFSYRNGPPAGFSGGFGEPTCQHCHASNPLNDPEGSLSLSGLPAELHPDSAFNLTVTLHRADLRVGGFQLTARFPNGRQAGTLHSASEATTILMGVGGIEYATHTRTGTAASQPDGVAWPVQWRSPQAIGASKVYFHLTANASNDDNSEFGDYVYARVDSVR